MAAAPPEDFLKRLIDLVEQERAAEEQESALLISNAPVSLLERSGLALGNLSGQTSIGLGGRLLVELERPPAYHVSPTYPPHDFRPGDVARLRQHGAGGAAGGAGKKGGKEDKGKGKDDGGVDAVVYRTTATKITLAVDEPPDDFILPDRIQMCVPLLLCQVPAHARADSVVLPQCQGRQPDHVRPPVLLPQPRAAPARGAPLASTRRPTRAEEALGRATCAGRLGALVHR